MHLIPFLFSCFLLGAAVIVIAFILRFVWNAIIIGIVAFVIISAFFHTEPQCANNLCFVSAVIHDAVK